jgi:hypothetical protein
VPTTKLYPEYASSITRPTQNQTQVAGLSNNKESGPNTKKQNSKITAKKGASNVYDERLLFGMFSDFVKNVSKILTGSLFTDVLKGVLKDKNQTWEDVLYKSLVDSGPSRIITDYISAFSVRIMKFLPPEISSQLFPLISVTLSRAATSSSNVNATSAANNLSEREITLRKEIEKQPIFTWVKNLSAYFEKNVQPKLNVIFEKLLGVSAGVELKDADGMSYLTKKAKS